MSSKTLKVFVTGESPRSLKKITLFNWSGYAYLGSKTHIKELEKRADTSGTGIYFLLSENESNTVSLYVGETDSFVERIKNHVNKEWWDTFVVFQSKDNLLNKAHVKHLERVFWLLAQDSTQIELMNSTSPGGANLAEEDLSDLKTFEENILFILEAMNLGYFSQKNALIQSANLPTYKTDVDDQEATMVIDNESYILKAGSFLKITPRESFERNNHGYFSRWKEISSDPKLVKPHSSTLGILKTDLEFTAPSLAGAIVKGGATNGLTAWRNIKTRKTLKEELEE